MESAYEAWLRANRHLPSGRPTEEYLRLEFPGENEEWLVAAVTDSRPEPRPRRAPRRRRGATVPGLLRRWFARGA